MNNIRDIRIYKWMIYVFALLTSFVYILIFHFLYRVSFFELFVHDSVLCAMFFIVIEWTFREIIRRENKIKNTMKELFSSYQYIGNVNRQIDILTNINNYISKADITLDEIGKFVVNTCARISEADFSTVFFYENSKKKYKKAKIYYCADKNKTNYFLSHLKCDSCTEYMSDNEEILEVDINSPNRCRHFPLSFWQKYRMFCVPFVYKGQKRGYLMLILKNELDITHNNLKLISSLTTQLGTAMN